MKDLLSKIDIEDFREVVKQETELDIDGTVLLQTWAERKSNNSVIKELFKNDLVLSFPFNNTDLVIEKSYLEDMRQAFFTAYKRVISLEIYRNRDIISTVFKEDIFSVPSDFSSTQLTVWAYRFSVSVMFDSLSEKLKLFVFLITNIDEIIESFIHGDEQKFEYLNVITYFSLKKQKNEKFYRWFGRLIKKRLGSDLSEYLRYDALLTKFSSFKDGIFSKKNQMVLCLSIHPKDFFSVSKGNNWTSCFRPDGDYASSITATLLSEDTIVAYILKKEDYLKMKVSETYVPRKVWRSFVLINPLQMLIVKGYPNHSKNVFKKIHSELQQLLKIEYQSIEKIETESIVIDEPEITVAVGYNDVVTVSEVNEYNPSSWFLNTSYLENSDWHTYINLSFQEMPMFLDTEKPFIFYTDDPSDLSNFLTLWDWEDASRCFDCDEHISRENGEVFTNEYDEYERCESCHNDFIESQEEEEEE